MVLAEAVFEAVLAITVLAAHADVGKGVDVGFALWVRALCCG